MSPQFADIVNECVSEKLRAHDELINEVSKQMSLLMNEMEELCNVKDDLMAEEKEEQKAKQKKAQYIARKQTERLMEQSFERAEKEREIAEVKKKSRKMKKNNNKKDAAAASGPNKVNSSALKKNLSVKSKPRGRIVGKVVENSLGGVVQAKKKANPKTTEFNAPRCANIGKGDLALEKQREMQAASQVKYPQVRICDARLFAKCCPAFALYYIVLLSTFLHSCVSK